MRWAQQDEEPPIEQVGEDTNGDIETLDEAAPPVEEGNAAGDIELLDQGPPVSAQEDVEVLDQAPAPGPAAESPAPPVATSEPVSTTVAPAAATGPFVPEGFGTGSVHVSTGAAGFPVGLEDCHVGAVTGRAFVGIDCGDGGASSFVGHAPSFEEFPFVLEEGFPFNRESVFAGREEVLSEDNVATLVSAARGATRDASVSAPEIRNSGTSSVTFEQDSRRRKPQVEAENGRAKRGDESHRGGNAAVMSSGSRDEGDQASAESQPKAKNRGKESNRGGSAINAEKKSNNSKQAKKHEDKKNKKSRTASD
jgi:hypothetical protein